VIGSVVAAFALVLLVGVLALVVAAALRERLAYSTHVRLVHLAWFTVLVGVWGVVVGCMFWIGS